MLFCNVLFHEPCPLFAMIFASARRATPLILCVHVYAAIAIYSFQRATPINSLLQDSKNANLAVRQGILLCKSTCSRFIACTNPLLPIQATFLCLQVYR